jgi:hypothetical protein
VAQFGELVHQQRKAQQPTDAPHGPLQAPSSPRSGQAPRSTQVQPAAQESAAEILERVFQKTGMKPKRFSLTMYDNHLGYQRFCKRFSDDPTTRSLYHLLISFGTADGLAQFHLRRHKGNFKPRLTLVRNYLQAQNIHNAADVICFTADELLEEKKPRQSKATYLGPKSLTLIREWLLSRGLTLAGETFEQATAKVRKEKDEEKNEKK